MLPIMKREPLLKMLLEPDDGVAWLIDGRAIIINPKHPPFIIDENGLITSVALYPNITERE